MTTLQNMVQIERGDKKLSSKGDGQWKTLIE
jgi:hypothetical protein